MLGSVLGWILEPFGLPNGVHVEGVWGVGFGVDFGMVSGRVWDASKFRHLAKSEGDWALAGALRKQNRLLIYEPRSLDEGQ